MKVFVPGAYTWGNKGDAALVVAFLEWLARDFDARDMELTSFTPRLDAQKYEMRVHEMVTRPMAPLRRAVGKVAGAWGPARRLLTSLRVVQAASAYWYIPLWVKLYRGLPVAARLIGARSLWELTSAIDSSDVAFAVPGGYLLAPKSSDDWWLYHIPNLLLTKALGKKLLLGPCSIGPFAENHKRSAARLLRSVDLIILREDLSREYLEELGVDSNRILLSPDMGFLHRPGDPTPAGERALDMLRTVRAGHTGVVGVSVRSHHFPGQLDPGNLLNVYLESVAQSVRELASNGAYAVIVVQTAEDLSISRRLSQILASVDVLHDITDPSLSPSDLQLLYGELDLLIGTRMHANILALTMGTPVVAIAYEPKTMGILASIGLESWGVWIDDVGGGRLSSMTIHAWQERVARRAIAAEGSASARSRFAGLAADVRRRLGMTNVGGAG